MEELKIFKGLVQYTVFSSFLGPHLLKKRGYTHPNGKSGLLENNGIFCFESPEHTRMLLDSVEGLG